MVWLRIGSTRREVRAIVFDKDGTLVRAESFWQYLAAARGEGVSALAGDRVRREWDAIMCVTDGNVDPQGLLAVGTPVEEEAVTAAVLAWRLGWPFAKARQEAARIIARADAGWDPAQSEPVPGFPGVMQRLAQRGLPLAVATSDGRERTHATLEAFGVAALVQAVVTAEDVARTKPAPDMLLKVAEAIGVEPVYLVMVGDSPVDMAMARAVGAIAVGVASDPGTAQRLREEGALAVIADLTEIICDRNGITIHPL